MERGEIMNRIVWNTFKIFIIFTVCTSIFYYGLRMMHIELEHYHRYDPPEGPSVKVFLQEQQMLERLNFFFRGE